jgi:hypothetical protein
MDNRLDMAAFFAGMMNNHSKISLSKLCTISRQDIDILATFLPLSTGLHELTLSGVARNPGSALQVFDAIRRNGSLWRLGWGISNPRRFFRCCVEMSPRPICLPILIWTKGLRTARRTRQIWSFSPCSFGWRAKLLEPRMAPNTILIGLLAAHEYSLGPQRVPRAATSHIMQH